MFLPTLTFDLWYNAIHNLLFPAQGHSDWHSLCPRQTGCLSLLWDFHSFSSLGPQHAVFIFQNPYPHFSLGRSDGLLLVVFLKACLPALSSHFCSILNCLSQWLNWHPLESPETSSSLQHCLFSSIYLFNWSIVDFHGCVSFGCIVKWFRHTFMYLFSFSIFSYRLLENIEYSSLCCTVGPCWLSISYIVMCIC